MSRLRAAAPLLLMFASGWAALAYQIIWTQQGALWLGHEVAAVLAVVSAFFGGMAVGAVAFGDAIERSEQPIRWYAGCELLIAIWGALASVLLQPLTALLLQLIGTQPSPAWKWCVAFLGTFVVLLPATAAMGATFPAMERVAVSWRSRSLSIAALYFANTLGAAMGVLATAVWLIPSMGLKRVTAVCVAMNSLCAIASLKVASARQQRAGRPATIAAAGILWRLAATGLLGIGFEVLVVRVLSQVTEDTVFTFALLLAVYLFGSAAGAGLYRRCIGKHGTSVTVERRLLVAVAAACLSGAAALWIADRIKFAAASWLGTNVAPALGAEAVLATVVFAPATACMGALFCHLCARATTSGFSVGRVLGINIVGAAAAPPLMGVLVLPTLGAKGSLLLVSAGYLLLIPPAAWRSVLLWIPAALTAALAWWAPRLAFIDVPAGGRVISYREGVAAAVSVVEDASGVARLRINNRQQEGSSATRRVDGRQAWLPLLLHPAPRRALFLGLGTGVTASTALTDPGLHVDAVELLPEVIAASAYFMQGVDAAERERLRLIPADARRFVVASADQYDVIVADNFHPARSGSAALYTVEHFDAVRRRLNAGGVFCQWLPLHQLDLITLRSIVQSFLMVFPNAWAMLASNSLETPVIGLVARADQQRFDTVRISERLDEQTLPLAEFGIEDRFALLGSFVGDASALRQFADGVAVNTDDRPVVAYLAPRITYAPDSQPRDRLIELLRQLSIQPASLLTNASFEEAERLAAYWRARNRFIELGRDVYPTNDVRDMLAQVRVPLLATLKLSPDFRPAYDPLLQMAVALAAIDTPTARSLLQDLQRLQPERTDAAAALQNMDAQPR